MSDSVSRLEPHSYFRLKGSDFIEIRFVFFTRILADPVRFAGAWMEPLSIEVKCIGALTER